jgi:hypothetical protein
MSEISRFLSQFLSQFLFVLRLLAYSAIASAIIKYVAPHWTLLTKLTNHLHADTMVDTMNAIAINLVIMPVALFAFVLWIKR